MIMIDDNDHLLEDSLLYHNSLFMAVIIMIIMITDLPTGGELVCVWVQGEGVGGDGDLTIIMMMIMTMIRIIMTWGMTLSPYRGEPST